MKMGGDKILRPSIYPDEPEEREEKMAEEVYRLSDEEVRKYLKVTIGFGQSGNEDKCVISHIGSCIDERGNTLSYAFVSLFGAAYPAHCFFKVNQIKKGRRLDFCTLNGITGKEIKKYPFHKNVTRISVE